MRGEQNKHLDYADTNYLHDARFIHFVLEKIILKLFIWICLVQGLGIFFWPQTQLRAKGPIFQQHRLQISFEMKISNT